MILLKFFRYSIVLLFIFSFSANAEVPKTSEAASLQSCLLCRNFWERKFSDVEFEMQGYITAYKKEQITEDELDEKFKPFDNDSLGAETLFDGWIKQFPKSYAARTARGIFFRKVAWSLRGNKLARETTKIQFENFESYLKRADADLRAAILLDDKPIQAYENLLEVVLGLGSEDKRAILDEAIKADKKSYLIRAEYLNSLSPKWGGDFLQMNAFINESNASSMTTDNKHRLESYAYFLKGDDARYRENYKEAISNFKKAYELYPKLVWRLESAAMAALDGNIKDEALDILNSLVKIQPKNVWALDKRGYLYESYYKLPKKAFDDYSLSADNGDSWAQNRVGWWYFTGTTTNKDYDKAEKYFRLAAAQGNKTAQKNLELLAATKKGQ